MSHFTVLVIGPDHEAALQPFHEFECTGTNDQYVQDVDRTDEARADFAASTDTMLRATDGTLHSFFDEKGEWRPEFSTVESEAPAFGSPRRKRFVPAGYEQVEVPTSELETFAQWAAGYYGAPVVPFGETPDTTDREAHKYGYILLDEAGEVKQLIKRTNPNKKWDWWQVGGRWSGLLKLKPGRVGETGRPGLMGSHFAKGDDRADQARKGDIDFDGMRDAAGEKAGALWDKTSRITGGKPWDSWEVVRERNTGNIDAAREEYRTQSSVVALRESKDDDYTWEIDDDLAGSREAFVQAARDQAGTTFALLHEGKWYEKGEMGWFACVSNEKAQAEWNREFAKLLDSLPDDTLLTVVDCHI